MRRWATAEAELKEFDTLAFESWRTSILRPSIAHFTSHPFEKIDLANSPRMCAYDEACMAMCRLLVNPHDVDLSLLVQGSFHSTRSLLLWICTAHSSEQRLLKASGSRQACHTNETL